jgi:hypothetical protein
MQQHGEHEQEEQRRISSGGALSAPKTDAADCSALSQLRVRTRPPAVPVSKQPGTISRQHSGGGLLPGALQPPSSHHHQQQVHRRSSSSGTLPGGASQSALLNQPQVMQALSQLEHCEGLQHLCGGERAGRLAAASALLSAIAAGVAAGRPALAEDVARAGTVARGALQAAMQLVASESRGSDVGGDYSLAAWKQPVPRNAGAHGASEAPLQALLQVLEGSPGRLQAAFANRCAADPLSPSFAMQPRHSLLPLTQLPAMLAEAMPQWSAQSVSYAARQLAWHVNVVSYTGESPVASGHQRGSSCGDRSQPSDMMYAEMAASIIAAAETEAAAGDARVLPDAARLLAAVAAALEEASGGGQTVMQSVWAEAVANAR